MTMTVLLYRSIHVQGGLRVWYLMKKECCVIWNCRSVNVNSSRRGEFTSARSSDVDVERIHKRGPSYAHII